MELARLIARNAVLTMATNAILHSQRSIKEGCAMSSRLVFSLLIVSMSIVMVWAFRPAPTALTGYSASPKAAQADQTDSIPR